MHKSILVIDTPESCDNCNFCCYSDGRVQICYWENKVIDKIKPDWCPLEPAPQEQEVWFDDARSDWERGYNSCLREIIGKDE